LLQNRALHPKQSQPELHPRLAKLCENQLLLQVLMSQEHCHRPIGIINRIIIISSSSSSSSSNESKVARRLSNHVTPQNMCQKPRKNVADSAATLASCFEMHAHPFLCCRNQIAN
jgi:hypothetical protein